MSERYEILVKPDGAIEVRHPRAHQMDGRRMIAEALQQLLADIAERDARIAELVNALLAIIEAPPDFASHVAATENARAAVAKAGA